MSYISIDHRGSRRGRKNWATLDHRQPSDDQADRAARIARLAGLERVTSSRPPQTLRQESLSRGHSEDVEHTHQVSNRGKFFCTSSDCYRSFRYEYEWARHEEAKHFCPYHWVCCLDDDEVPPRIPRCFLCGTQDVPSVHFKNHTEFRPCNGKDRTSRTFFREDHLIQHIRNTHSKQWTPSKTVLEPLLVAWKTDNPLLSADALFCGFCHTVFDTWELRKEHISKHFAEPGVSKEKWLSREDFHLVSNQ